MKAFQFEEDVFCQYNHFHVISNMGIAIGLVSYTH
jgi:hypothetical protein